MRDHILHRGHGPWHHAWHHAPHSRGRWHGKSHERDWHGHFGAWGGPPWGGRSGGRWGGPKERLERGMLRYIILDVLKDGPKHGYEIIKLFEERTGGLYSPSPGTLYPTLQYLEDLGLVRSEQQEDRRVYSLTEKGRAELKERADLAEGFWHRFRDRTPPAARRYELSFLEDALRDLARTVWGGLRGAMFRGDDETVRQVRLAIERCQNEVREIIARSAGGGSASSDERSGMDAPSAGSEETSV